MAVSSGWGANNFTQCMMMTIRGYSNSFIWGYRDV